MTLIYCEIIPKTRNNPPLPCMETHTYTASAEGHKVTRGVPYPQSTRINLSNNKITLSTPSRRDPNSRTPESETILPLRQITSATLDFPDNSYCKYVAGAFGFVSGIASGAAISSSRAASGGSVVAGSTIMGSAAAGGMYMLCTSRQALLTLKTNRDDYQFSFQADQKDQSVHLFRTLRREL